MLALVARHAPELLKLAALAESFGIRMFLVGGPVRDLLLGQIPKDWDITSPATPNEYRRICESLTDVAVYDVGEEHGTTGTAFTRGDGQMFVVEHTTHRREYYDPESRSPKVTFGDRLADDLARRDFTVNAMALDLVSGELIDPFDGAADLATGVLRTPDDPTRTFSEDPLRIMRLVRFAVLRGLVPTEDCVDGAARVADRLSIVSVERITAELLRLLDAGGDAFVSTAAMLARIGAAGAAFGPLDVDATVTALVRPDALVDRVDCFAALAVHTGPSADPALRAMKLTNSDVRAAVAAAAAFDALESVGSPSDARRLLRGTGVECAKRVARLSVALDAPVRRQGFLLGSLVHADPGFASRKLPVDGNDAAAAGFRGRDIGTALRRVEDALCVDPQLDRAQALELLASVA